MMPMPIPVFGSRWQRGVTLIELMISMLIGLLVTGGMISLFIATSSSNRAQTQLATLQEEGRFAVAQLSHDLHMANGFYCSNMGGAATSLSGGLSLDNLLRAPRVLVAGGALTSALHDVTTNWGSSSGGNTYPAMPIAPYYLPAFFSMRGYDCTTTRCAPVDPSSGTAIPTMAASAGQRVPGAGVLTVRYLDSSRGWALDSSKIIVAGNTVASIALANAAAGEPSLSDYSGGPLMLADCNSAQIFAANRAGGIFTPAATGNFSGSTVAMPSGLLPKLFDFQRDFQTVTYYLKEVSDNNGHLTGALIRRLNGGPTSATTASTDMELVRGVERLDFRYGVLDKTGLTKYYAASELDTINNCASSVPSPLGNDPGCLWRSVQSIEVHLLMDGQLPLYTLTANEMAYTYWGDSGDALASPMAPSAHTIKPTDQGFDEHLLRREFSALISVRNYNP